MIRLLSDRELADLVREKKLEAVRECEDTFQREKKLLQDNHDWEVRRLTARAVDAEEQRDRFKGAYKRAVDRLSKYRKQIARMSANLRAAGLSQSEGPGEDGKPRLDTVQGIMDSSLSEIPGMDDMAQGQVRAYVERELRKRGPSAGPQILEEVITGDLPE